MRRMRSATGAPGDAYFERVGERSFRATAHVGGAWSLEEQHIAPALGLLAHLVETDRDARRDDGLVLGRLSYDILGTMPIDVVDTEVRVLRPGRTIELVEAVAVSDGRAVLRARAWRLARHDTGVVAGGHPDPLPPPDGLASVDLSAVWLGGYIASLDVRPLRAPEPGRATVWLATPVALVADEPVSELARFVGLVDTANGIAVRVPPTEWAFPNLDLTIHLFREPQGDWLGLDTSVVFSADGRGLTTSTLHDLSGPIGRAEQILTLRPRTD